MGGAKGDKMTRLGYYASKDGKELLMFKPPLLIPLPWNYDNKISRHVKSYSLLLLTSFERVIIATYAGYSPNIIPQKKKERILLPKIHLHGAS